MSEQFNYLTWLNKQEMPKGKRKIIQASIDLFADKGYSSTTTASIARKSNLSEATIFKYFKSKLDLLTAIIDPIIEKIVPTESESFSQKISLHSNSYSINQLIEYFISDRYNFIEQNNKIVSIILNQLLIDKEIRQQLVKKVNKNLTLILQIFQTALDQDSQVMDNINAEDIAQLIGGQLLSQFLCEHYFKLPIKQNKIEIVNKITTFVQHAIHK